MNQPATQPSPSATTLCTIRSRNSSRCSTKVARNSSGSSEEFRMTFHQGVFAMAKNYLLFEDVSFFNCYSDELGRCRCAEAAAHTRTLTAKARPSATARAAYAGRSSNSARALLQVRGRRRKKRIARSAAAATAVRRTHRTNAAAIPWTGARAVHAGDLLIKRLRAEDLDDLTPVQRKPNRLLHLDSAA